MLLDAQHLDPVAAVRQHIAHALFRAHQLALLVDDHAVERLGEFHLAAVGRELAGEQLQERGLARAVAADDADPVAARDPQAKVADDGALPISLGRVLGVDHRSGAHVVGADRQIGRALRAQHRRAFGAHLLQLGKAPLVAAAAAGDAALEPMFFQLEPRI